MVEPTTAVRRTRVATLVSAYPSEVYRAFLDPESLATWLPPGVLTGRVHDFDPREDGAFRISFMDGDRVHQSLHGRFVELVPSAKVVTAVEFESSDPAMAGEMRVTATFAESRQGTFVTLVSEDVPAGIALDDHQAAWESSLEKLGILVDHVNC